MDTPPVPVPFHIDVTRQPPVVEIDGVDVAARIAGVTVELGYQAPTTVTLQMARAGSLTGTGIVVAGDTMSAAERVLQLNPDQVEAATMSGPCDADTMAENYMVAIAALLDGSAR